MDLFPIKITIYGIGMLRYVHFQAIKFNLNQHKIIYRLRYKTLNFKKLEFLVTKKLRHFEFG